MIREVHLSVMAGVKIQHFNELRGRYERAKHLGKPDELSYWHFVWRFETYSELEANLLPSGFVRFKILGVNNPAFETQYENQKIPIYNVNIIDTSEPNVIGLGRGYCWCLNGTAFISNNADENALHEPTREFQIVGLGPIKGGPVRPMPPNYSLVRQLENPSESWVNQNVKT